MLLIDQVDNWSKNGIIAVTNDCKSKCQFINNTLYSIMHIRLASIKFYLTGNIWKS